ncbi:hypothetical protein MTR_1g034410 [Medicago truncatula]|uniref:Uncharacterized protein n=1 Tax=Medicago truncatula TaxID=3880 RepID=A0A072VG48_MEDTR|nr:hypothetical protein MTR_1g034410 [Medicago truncatula]
MNYHRPQDQARDINDPIIPAIRTVGSPKTGHDLPILSSLHKMGHDLTTLELAQRWEKSKTYNNISPNIDTWKILTSCHCESEFLASLDPNEKVVLVGHSFGGMSIALAMETRTRI